MCCIVCGVIASVFLFAFFFFKQKTAYEMRISDWSSDVCSSDLDRQAIDGEAGGECRRAGGGQGAAAVVGAVARDVYDPAQAIEIGRAQCRDRVCQYV